MTLITIDTVALPNPSEYSVTTSDSDSSDTKKDEQGYVHRDRIREGQLKITAGWKSLTLTELKLIATAVKPASFSCVFFNPIVADYSTITAHASANRTSKAVIIPNETINKWDIAFSIVEF